MKRILITGKGSYIGTAFKNYLSDNFSSEYIVDELDVHGDSWEKYDFSSYDSVYHVAGLAHSTPDESQRDYYYKINTDLAVSVASKAKSQGVKQFIFMSSVIVYGSGKIGESRNITRNTPLTPDNFYGDSKKRAEEKILAMADHSFFVCIIRPPMIYGKNSKGNYPLLAKFARKSLLFPNFSNQRSMLYIGNLVEFVRLLIKNNDHGIFFPQNKEYVCVSDLVKKIAEENNHKIKLTALFNPLIRVFKRNVYISKVFGNFTIDMKLSEYPENYNIFSFAETIHLTEGK